jgi:hypothetical protein
MPRALLEVNFNPDGVKYYSVIDTLFNKLVIQTSSTHLAHYMVNCVNVCEHEIIYDYMQHFSTKDISDKRTEKILNDSE